MTRLLTLQPQDPVLIRGKLSQENYTHKGIFSFAHKKKTRHFWGLQGLRCLHLFSFNSKISSKVQSPLKSPKMTCFSCAHKCHVSTFFSHHTLDCVAVNSTGVSLNTVAILKRNNTLFHIIFSGLINDINNTVSTFTTPAIELKNAEELSQPLGAEPETHWLLVPVATKRACYRTRLSEFSLNNSLF